MPLAWQALGLVAYILIPLCTAECFDDGCSKDYEGLGKCLDVTKINYNQLTRFVDLRVGSKRDGCKNDGDDTLCKSCNCFKLKNCYDDGCKDTFDGLGVCVDVTDADWAAMDKYVDWSAGKKDGLCRNINSQHCCGCFKKKCPQTEECNVKKGKCLNPEDPSIPNDWEPRSDASCESRTCKCYSKKDDEPTCIQSDRCKEKDGICMYPGKDDIPTFWEPTSIPCGRDCKCYVKKDDEPICTQSDHCKEKDGRCMNPGKDDIPTFLEPTSIPCGRDCKCYVKKDDEPICTQSDHCKEKDGRCMNPDKDEIPINMEPTSIDCGSKDCKCYVKKSDEPICTQSDHCKEKDGRCMNPDKDTIPINMEPTSIDCGSKDCKCYVKKSDEPTCPRNPKCQKMRGKCFGPKEEHTAPDGYKAVFECGNECRCFAPPIIPKCTNSRCAKAKGRCFIKGVKIPAGSKPMRGKLAWCNKKLNCKCYKVKG